MSDTEICFALREELKLEAELTCRVITKLMIINTL